MNLANVQSVQVSPTFLNWNAYLLWNCYIQAIVQVNIKFQKFYEGVSLHQESDAELRDILLS